MLDTFTLDIDEKYTKVIDAHKSGDRVQINNIAISSTAEFFYTSNQEKTIDSQVITIKKLIETAKITKKKVNVIIPDSITYSQIISMPLLNEKELITAIKYQADQFIPMPIEETNIDIEVVLEDQNQKKALLLIVAAPKKVIERVQTVVELAGLDPQSVENELSSISRLLNNCSKTVTNFYKLGVSKGIVLANFDVNSTSLIYLSPGDLLLKEVHHVSTGYQLFLKEAQVNTDTDILKTEEMLKTYNKNVNSSYALDKIVQPLVKEFSNEIKLFINRYNPGSVFFTNKIFLFPSLVQSLTDELKFPISIFDPTAITDFSKITQNFKNELPVFVAAFGGSLRD